MPELQSDILCVKEYLKSQHMNVLDEWLEGCVQFFNEQRTGRSYNHQELNNMARDQWLLGDLTEICPGCLPNNLSNQLKTKLTGIYVLQMDLVVDIGVPAYQQLQKLTKVDTTNIEVTVASNQTQYPEPTSHRMLKLSLTDGVQEISGMEYKPMRNLSTDLMPGTKLQIKGPVDCRRGVLMLEEKHVTVLGGEVEDLVLQNNYRNVLSRIVCGNNTGNSRDTTPVSQFTRERVPRPALVSSATTNNSLQNHNTNISRPQNRNQNMISRPADNMQSTIPRINNTIEERELNNLDVDMFNDDFDVDMIADIENSATNPSTSHQTTPHAVAKKMRIGNIDRNEYIVKKLSPKREDYYETEFRNSSVDYPQPNEEEEFLRMIEMEDIDHADEPDDRNFANKANENLVDYPISINNKPFVYLKQLVDTPTEVSLNETFTVKAQVISIINKLKFKNGDWDLKCKICDGTSYLDVDVSGDVLSLLVGYTSSEMSRMRNQMASNPQLKQQVVQGLADAHRKLQTSDTLMEVLYKPTGPCIMRITEYTDEHLRMLKQRAHSVGK